MRKLYSLKSEGSDICYELEYFTEMLKEDDHNNSYVLEIWEQEIGTGIFWCREEGEAFESSEGVCGLECSAYSPRNGKSGRCRKHDIPFSPTGKFLTIEKQKMKPKPKYPKEVK